MFNIILSPAHLLIFVTHISPTARHTFLISPGVGCLPKEYQVASKPASEVGKLENKAADAFVFAI